MLLNILLVILVLDCVALTGVILMQRSEGGALGMGGGPSGMFTARGAGDLLTRVTSICTAIFFILSLAITLLAGHTRENASLTQRMKVNPLDLSALANASSAPPAASSAPGAPPLPTAAPPLPTAVAPALPGAAPPLPGAAPPLPGAARPTARQIAPTVAVPQLRQAEPSSAAITRARQSTPSALGAPAPLTVPPPPSTTTTTPPAAPSSPQ